MLNKLVWTITELGAVASIVYGLALAWEPLAWVGGGLAVLAVLVARSAKETV